MIVSTYRPYFCPFPAFFHKAHLSDLLVILDDVQFPRGTTWISRNRFKNDHGTLWVTIPLWKKGLGLQKINQVRICYEGRWERKHLASLKIAYAKAPYWTEHSSVVEDMFSGRFQRLVELNMMVIEYLKNQLGIDTPLMMQSDLGAHAKGNDLLIQICRKVGASHYLTQDGAKKYLNAKLFEDAGITIVFYRPADPVYPQLWGSFIHHLSAFDLLFNCGPKSHEILCGSPGHFH